MIFGKNPCRRALRFLKSVRPDSRVVLVPLALAAGLALWLAVRGAQGLLSGPVSALPEWLALAVNAGIEESLRLGLAVMAVVAIRRLGLRPALLLYGVAASWAFASAENLSYLAAFPSADVYWRLGYSLPIHLNAAALYAVALKPAAEGAGAAIRCALAFLAAWIWHSAFNVAAGTAPFAALPAIGSAFNLVALVVIVVMIESTFVVQGALHGRRQA